MPCGASSPALNVSLRVLHMLPPAEKKWASRLAEVSRYKDELVRLLGLINVLNLITARESSLETGAASVVKNLTNYLLLDYCAFYVFEEGADKLLAERGGLSSPLYAGSWNRA
jgi:hypothetical protein